MELTGSRFSNPELIPYRSQRPPPEVMLDEDEALPAREVAEGVDDLGVVRLELNRVGRTVLDGITEHLVEPADVGLNGLEVDRDDRSITRLARCSAPRGSHFMLRMPSATAPLMRRDA